MVKGGGSRSQGMAGLRVMEVKGVGGWSWWGQGVWWWSRGSGVYGW